MGATTRHLTPPSHGGPVAPVSPELARSVRRILGCVGVGVFVYDHDGCTVEANPTALALVGLDRTMLGGHVTDHRSQPIREDGSAISLGDLPVVRALRTREPVDGEILGMRRRDGSLIWLLISAWPLVVDDHLLGAVVTVVDHTARREVERTERTVSRATQVLVRATDEASLLQEMCRTIVEAGGYELAWIGRAEDDPDRSVSVLAAAGAVDYVEPEMFTWADVPLGRGPTGISLREGRVGVANDFTSNPRLAPWIDRAHRFGFGSSVAIPFCFGDGSRAALSIYARDIEAFDEPALALLGGLARDLEFGLRHLRSTDELTRSEERFRLLAENTGDIVMVSRRGVIEWTSPSIEAMLGWRPDEIVGRDMSDFTHPDDRHVKYRVRADVALGRADTYRGRVRCRDGSHLWVDVRARVGLGADGLPDGTMISTVWNTTAEVTAQAALEHAASHDSLTGLANRSLLLDELERALAAGRRSGDHTAVLLLDLDHFKYVNDSLGHAVGDELLCAAAHRMHDAVRHGDLVARQGGDEFVVVMRDLPDPTEAVRVAERLAQAFRQPIRVGDAELFTTASIGVAVATGSEQDGIDLLREADTAMYRAKEEGRDRFSLFNEDLRGIVTERLRIANELRVAVERDELAVWFQPEVSLDHGGVCAVEALLRWHHPSGETYAANRFIETAEETGMILDIGRWVLQESCRHAVRWARHRPDPPLVVRVNLSSLQLSEAGLLEDLDDALGASGLAPDLLCVEITETSMLHETATVRANMAGIHRRGVRMAIDDFGTGYASLTYLRRYPIDVVKLDRSFVTNLDHDDADRQITAGIIDLAGRLGITVTAEGVERPEQAEVLCGLGCAGAQGYLYSPAVPPEQVPAMLAGELAGQPCPAPSDAP